MLQPGTLSLNYVHGSRRAYIGPFALFLLANVVFVGMEAIVADSNIFASPLLRNMYEQPWSFFAPELVARRLDALGTTMEAFAPLFNRDVALHAKSLIIMMVFPFALLPALIFARSHLPFASHLAFSLHFHAFLLLLLSVALAITYLDALFGGPGMASQLLDNGIAADALFVCGIYLYCAAGKVYGASGVLRVAKTALLTFAAMLIFLGFRFFLFILTLYTTAA
jgi:hypothetical protein